MQNKIVTDIIDKNIEQHIASATGRIAKCAYGHEPFKRRIKIIYEAFDLILQMLILKAEDSSTNKKTCEVFKNLTGLNTYKEIN